MKLLTTEDLAKATHLNMPGGNIIASALMQLFKYNKLNKLYSSTDQSDPMTFIDSIIELLGIKYEISEEDMKNIPAEGSFITISNHPYGGIDAMLIVKLIYEKRPDYKVMANFLLKRIEPIKDIVLAVNPFETHKDAKSSFTGIKEGLAHVDQGHCFGIFPAGEVSTYQDDSAIISDREWQASALKFIKKAKVPVIPVYFHGTNSRWFHILGTIHPLLRTAKLPSELFNKRNKPIRIRIGKPISVKEQAEFTDIATYGRYLRARTYSLGTLLEPKRFYFKRFSVNRKAEQIVEPESVEILRQEFENVRSEYELFTNKNYSVVCAPTVKIPHIFNEIGRLREITFREVGEGTNKAIDIDEYDFYYNHLFIWDTDENRIVGAYRIGKGKDILNLYGVKGFYLNSLFKLKNSFKGILGESIELGRSFIVTDYQRKPLPLFMLWKGILFFLLKNTDYRYLIGPVSISADLSKFSRSLIVEYVRTYCYNEELAALVEPRKNFVPKPGKTVDRKIFIDNAGNDINKIEKVIRDIEAGYRIPVLLKKYLELNAKIIGFNVDPKFNDCLDGLIVLDLFDIPIDFVKGLSKEVNDLSVLERFNHKDLNGTSEQEEL